MATWNTTVTNKGLALQAKQVSGAAISFTRVVSGAGIAQIVDLKNQTAVMDVKQKLSVEGIRIDGSKYIISVLLSNNSVTTEYNLSQIGFYATDPSEGEILFAISQIDTPKPIPTSESAPGYSIEFSFTFQNSNNAVIEINPDMAGYVTRAEVANIVNEKISDAIELGPDIEE